MKTAYNFLRLIRYPNLLFIILTQCFFHFLIVIPILANWGFISAVTNFNFGLLVLATVLLAAGGYIINDYFDVKIDAINKPQKLFISKLIHRRSAIIAHQVFTFIAIAIGVYLAWQVQNFRLAFIFPIVAALLWFYSTTYKRQTFVGNFIVALLTGLVVLMVVLYEQPLFKPTNYEQVMAGYAIFIRAFFYFLFAFLVSLIREIVKDMEDKNGDEIYGCKTLPIILGMQKTKSIVYLLGIIVIILIGFVQTEPFLSRDYLTVIYLMQTVQFPMFVMQWLLYRADTQKDFNRISTLVKVVMLMGILTMGYFYFLMA